MNIFKCLVIYIILKLGNRLEHAYIWDRHTQNFPTGEKFSMYSTLYRVFVFFFLPLALEVLESEYCLVESFLKIRVNQEYFCFKQVESFSKTLIWASVIKSFTVLLSVNCEDEIC